MASREPGPGARDRRREGGPTVREFVLAVVLVLAIAVVAFVVLGGQTSADPERGARPRI